MFKNIRKRIYKFKKGILRMFQDLKRKIDEWRTVLSWSADVGRKHLLHYQVLWTWGHYTVRKDGSFFCTADTVEEAEREIKKDMEEEFDR
jgi:hypothetical protein